MMQGLQGPQGREGALGRDFYTTDGSLTSTRTVNLNGHQLNFANGEVRINGKLNVTGLIDPTGLVLTEFNAPSIPVPPNSGALYVSDGSDGHLQNTLIYKFANGTTANLIQNQDSIEGAQGPIGVQASLTSPGTQGVQGIFGLMGSEGTQGFPGATALIGNQGLQGPFGSQGVPGPLINPGIQGHQGSMGYIGNQGLQGDIGIEGSQGAQASAGNQGLIGLQGSVNGNQGTQGAQGTQGTVGNQGPQAFMGSQGVQSFQGVLGIAGIGNQGAQGFVGQTTEGNQGVQGLEGVGVDGLPGLQGAQNAQGYEGIQGLVGGVSGGGGLPIVTQASNLLLDQNSAVVTGYPGMTVFPDYLIHRTTLTSVIGQNDFFTCPVGRRAILMALSAMNVAAWAGTLYWKGTNLVYHPLSNLNNIGSFSRPWHTVFVLEAGEAYSLNSTVAGVSILATMISFDAANPISPRTARAVMSTAPAILHTATAGKITYGLSTENPILSNNNIISPATLSPLYVQQVNFSGASVVITMTVTPNGDTAKTANIESILNNALIVAPTGWIMFPGDIITVTSSSNTATQEAYTTFVEL